MAILSIQSQVASGHVGNSAAVFALQLRGRAVWPVPTMLLSHHPGHGGALGGPVPAELLGRMLDGLADHGCFSHCEAVLSGYLGQAAAAGAVRRAVAAAKAGTADAVYLCDPVLGDDGRLYVAPDIVAAMHDLAAAADIVTPNAFELAMLSGQPFTTLAEAVQAMRLLQRKGPDIVILTSFAGSDTAPGILHVLGLDGTALWSLRLPDRGGRFHGAGDLLAGLFLDAWLPGRDTPTALARACAGVQQVLARGAAPDGEMQLLPPAPPPPPVELPERIA